MKRTTCWSWAAAVLVLSLSGSRVALAQTAPTPGGPEILRNPALNPDIINEEERRRLEEKARPKPKESAPIVQAPSTAPARSSAPDVRFILKKVQFDPSHYLKAKTLQGLARPLIGTEVGFAQIQTLIDAVNALYARAGVATARAILPPQTVTDGTLRIQLVEGRIGARNITGGSRGLRQELGRIVMGPGALADPRVLADELKRFNLENDTQARAGLAQGQAQGATDLTVELHAPPRLSADVFADDNGFTSTGTWEEGAVVRAFRLFDSTDRASAVYEHAAGVESGSLNYSRPLAWGFRGSLNASAGETSFTSKGQAGPVTIDGSTRSFGGDVSRVILVRGPDAVTADVQVQDTRSTTNVAGPRVLDNRLYQFTGSLTWRHDEPGLLMSLESDLSEARLVERISHTERDPILLRGGFLLDKLIGNFGLEGRLRADWQESFSDNLPALLQLQIGGAHSARAWAPATASGDSGVSGTMELALNRRLFRQPLELFTFFDHAQVFAPQNDVYLEDVGLGFGFTILERVSLRASYALGVGSHGYGRQPDRVLASATLHF